MLDIFLTVCMLTSLSCNDINVQYDRLPFDTYAIAAIDIYGNYHIFVDHSVRKKKSAIVREIVVHEVAHLLVFEADPSNNTHNEAFDKQCEKLSERVGIKPNSACAASGGTPSSWHPHAHYKRDE